MSPAESPSTMRSEGIPIPTEGPCLLAHGGAWDIPDAYLGEQREALHRAVEAGRAELESGGKAVDVVTLVVAAMESAGVFDAGCGSVLTRKGTVEMDAGVMDGESLAFGSVAAVHRLGNPIWVARRLLDDGAGMVRILVGESAERFAAAEGILPVDPISLIHARERLRFVHLQAEAAFHPSEAFLPGGARMPSGTVGCVARDAEGRLAAATSTGGTPYRPPGRVGDTPLPGCGFYADRSAAVSTTGWGEAIASSNLAGRVVCAIERGLDPETAAREELSRMAERIANDAGECAAGGVIVLGREGSAAWAYTTPRMVRGGWAPGRDAWSSV
jgi:beta-aspartyl-peptidase (threonine type)